jgi:hypothetical protein
LDEAQAQEIDMRESRAEQDWDVPVSVLTAGKGRD